jgi:LDH2 family malate/lactate/ureidoglycolate dehydrogenase
MPASYANHRAQLKAILLGWGMPEENAEITSEILSWADLHGIDSHGISMIPGYDRLRRDPRWMRGLGLCVRRRCQWWSMAAAA